MTNTTDKSFPLQAGSPFHEKKELVESLEFLLEKMNRTVKEKHVTIEQLHEKQKTSGANLLHYLALRSEDIRVLQDELHVLGLSSLASSESHILRQVQTILQRLGKECTPGQLSSCDYFTGSELIRLHAEQLFGTKKAQDIPYLMVTFDTEFADNYHLVRKLLEAGMNIARINCAHDNKEVWQSMIDTVKKASETTGIPCQIYMDLAGPKMRTTILGKGRLNGKAMLFEGQEIIFAEKDADYDPSGVVIGCEEEGMVYQLKEGQRILFDDGLVETTITSIDKGIAVLKINRISGKKPQLKAQKGINFPDSSLTLPALTAHDLEVLPFVCEHAGLAGYSFIHHPSDLKQLQQELSKYSRKPSIILKIETADAVKNFPALLIQGLQDEVVGVMIARGDLAVEIGFERLSEIQEEILWISEAAHVPVIWATQVLETQNKSGIATRSEITDAAYAAHSECVMLNKGNYIISVLKTLLDILHRSGGHHAKKRYTSRTMRIATDYLNNG